MAHGQHGVGGDARALRITGWLTGVYFLIELTVGLTTGSIAVLSDAFHTFSAVGGVLIALVAAQIARRPASQFATFGWMRAEIVGALLNGLFLFGMAVIVMWMGAMRLRNPIHIPTAPMLWVAVGGLVTEAVAFRLLFAGQKENLNLKGAFWHVLQTLVGSFIIIIAALVIRFTGFMAIDPLLGMAFGLALFWASYGIIRDALHILLDAVPRDLDLGALTRAVGALPEVLDVHHAHAWALTSGKNVVSMHVLIPSMDRAEELHRTIRDLLSERFGVYFATVQLETECLEIETAAEIDYSRAAATPRREST
jgi:cobalt-zinc-cadmium efflux system protein